MTSSIAVLAFGPFVLEEENARLTRNGEPLDIPPKPFAVLCHLARNAPRLVTKDELLDAVWGHRHVSESVLKTAVNLLRTQLGDDPKAPRYIETASRRGYRFIGSVQPIATLPPTSSSDTVRMRVRQPGAFIAREPVFGRLRALWTEAQSGRRQLVLIAGEPGIGKSTVIDTFTAEVSNASIAYGQCVDQYGRGEPYLPVLEALNSRCGRDPKLLSLLRQVAPTWLVQLPWHLQEGDRATLSREVAGATQDRMLREMGELLERSAATQPLMLVLEDLHWSDVATVHLLDYLARRRSAAQLMIIGSYRPADLIINEHPLDDLRRELRLHRLCEEIHLEGFSLEQVAAYLQLRFGAPAADPQFVPALHRHTDGLPLFLASVLDELIEEGAIVQSDGGWRLQARTSAGLPVPEKLTDVINKQIQRLPADARALLEAAAVAGTEFLHLVMAEALELDPNLVQSKLDGLVRRKLWVRPAGFVSLPDGRLAVRYAFRHALFRHVLSNRSTPSARVTLHRRIGVALERLYGARASEIASELASHAEEGREAARAARHYATAAQNALQRFAPEEALLLVERGLAQMAAMPTASRREPELSLLSARVSALMVTQGYSAPEVCEAIGRAFELIAEEPLSPATLPIWHAAWWTFSNAGRRDRSEPLTARLLQLTASDRDLGRVTALSLQGVELFVSGAHERATGVLEESLRIQEEISNAAAPFVQDLRMEVLCHLSVCLELTGNWTRAAAVRSQIESLIDLGTDPLTESMGDWYLICAYQFRRQLSAALTRSERAIQHLQKRTALPGAGPHRVSRGWALVMSGEHAAGIEFVRSGLSAYIAQGSKQGMPLHRAFAAEALLTVGDLDSAQAELDAGRASEREFGEYVNAANITRLYGRLARLRGQPLEAERQFREAIAEAKGQRALLLEVLACADLARLLDEQNRRAETCPLLQDVLERCGDSATAPAIQEARTLLHTLRGEQ